MQLCKRLFKQIQSKGDDVLQNKADVKSVKIEDAFFVLTV
jgi:hypothetical protein